MSANRLRELLDTGSYVSIQRLADELLSAGDPVCSCLRGCFLATSSQEVTECREWLLCQASARQRYAEHLRRSVSAGESSLENVDPPKELEARSNEHLPSPTIPGQTSDNKSDTFGMKTESARELTDALVIVEFVGDVNLVEVSELRNVDGFTHQLRYTLRGTEKATVRVTLHQDVWGAIMYVNGEQSIVSGYMEDPDPEELAAMDLVNDFLVASGRKLGCSIFRSPKDREEFEEVLGTKLDLLE